MKVKKKQLFLLPISSVADEFDGFEITFERFPSSWSQHLWSLNLYRRDKNMTVAFKDSVRLEYSSSVGVRIMDSIVFYFPTHVPVHPTKIVHLILNATLFHLRKCI